MLFYRNRRVTNGYSARISPSQTSATLLALVTSTLITVRDNNLIEDGDMSMVVNLGLARMMEIVRDFPADGPEDFVRTRAQMIGVSKIINGRDQEFSLNTVVYMGHKILADLLGELCHPAKRELVQEANKILTRVNDFLDPDGEDEETHKEVEEIVEEVYKFVGFRTDLRYFKHLKKLQRRALRHGRAAEQCGGCD